MDAVRARGGFAWIRRSGGPGIPDVGHARWVSLQGCCCCCSRRVNDVLSRLRRGVGGGSDARGWEGIVGRGGRVTSVSVVWDGISRTTQGKRCAIEFVRGWHRQEGGHVVARMRVRVMRVRAADRGQGRERIGPRMGHQEHALEGAWIGALEPVGRRVESKRGEGAARGHGGRWS